jgi:hypothetical protein
VSFVIIDECEVERHTDESNFGNFERFLDFETSVMDAREELKREA